MTAKFWMYETTGVLWPAIWAYLKEEPMSDAQIAVMRAYLRQWIMDDGWRGEGVNELRNAVDGLISRRAIVDWLRLAEELGLDPL